jgi:AraC family transcriptional regulator
MPDLPDLANLDYVHRVNRAIDHVTRHLAEPLQLDDVAKVACFSPFHFHRIFRALIGETLHAFIKRVRLERALHMMSNDPNRSLTEIALALGFSSSSDFSRSFRTQYGVPPSAFDLELYRRTRREKLIDATLPDERHRLAQLPVGENPDGFAPRIRTLPERRVAYIRVLNPYGSPAVGAAYTRMMAWAKERGLTGGQWLGYQWEDPEIVPLEQCRYDVGLEIPESVVVEGDEVNVTRFAPMTVAELDILGTIDLEMRALDWIYKTWLPTSGFVPDQQPAFEAWNGEPFALGYERFDLRLQLAIVDANAPL